MGVGVKCLECGEPPVFQSTELDEDSEYFCMDCRRAALERFVEVECDTCGPSPVTSRAAEKQASRDADAKALATGEKTREDLWRENSFVPAEIARTPIDFSRITCQVCGNTYEYTPRGDGSPHPYQDEVMGYCGDSPPTEQVRGRAARLPKR